MNIDSNQIQQSGKGFIKALFDFSFSEFIVPKIIKFLFMLGMVVAGLAALVFIVAGFANGAGAGILCLILSPVIFLLYVIMARIWLETVMVFFSINDRLKNIDAKTKP